MTISPPLKPKQIDALLFWGLLPGVVGTSIVFAVLLGTAVALLGEPSFLAMLGLIVVPLVLVSCWALRAFIRLWLRLVRELKGSLRADLTWALLYSCLMPVLVVLNLYFLEDQPRDSGNFIRGRIVFLALVGYALLTVATAVRLVRRREPVPDPDASLTASDRKAIAMIWALTIGAAIGANALLPAAVGQYRMTGAEKSDSRSKDPFAQAMCKGDLGLASSMLSRPDARVSSEVVSTIMYSCMSKYTWVTEDLKGMRFFVERAPLMAEAIALAEKQESIESHRGCTPLQTLLLGWTFKTIATLPTLALFRQRGWPVNCEQRSFDRKASVPLWWTTVYQGGLTPAKLALLKANGIDFDQRDSEGRNLVQRNLNGFLNGAEPGLREALDK